MSNLCKQYIKLVTFNIHIQWIYSGVMVLYYYSSAGSTWCTSVKASFRCINALIHFNIVIHIFKMTLCAVSLDYAIPLFLPHDLICLGQSFQMKRNNIDLSVFVFRTIHDLLLHVLLAQYESDWVSWQCSVQLLHLTIFFSSKWFSCC